MFQRRAVTFCFVLLVTLRIGVCIGKPPNIVDSDRQQRRNWPGFRGYLGQGVCQARTPPRDWDGVTGRNILWKSNVPLPGNSSPIVWEDRVFLTGATEKERVVYCFDAKTGALRWQKQVRNVPDSPDKPPEVSPDAGFASPTMACDGQRVFAVFANGDLACFDLKGTPIWSQSLGLPKIDFGFTSSLLVYEKKLFIQQDQTDGGRVLALATDSGKIVWEKKRKLRWCWSSPILAETSTGPQLILNGNPDVIAYAPATGAVLWKVECMSGELTPSPAFADDVAVVAQDYVTCAAINTRSGKLAWDEDDLDLPDTASPVADHGLVFVPSSVGTVSCLNLRKGTVAWTKEFDEGFSASPIIVGDRVFLLDRNGQMHILKAAADYQELGSPELGEESVCTPAFLGRQIYIRTTKHLYAIGTPQD